MTRQKLPKASVAAFWMQRRDVLKWHGSGMYVLLLMLCFVTLSIRGEVYQAPVNHRLEQTIDGQWTFNYFPAENADAAGYEAPGFDDSTWPAVALPHTWQTYETTGKLHPFIADAIEKPDNYWWKGWGWYRKHFSISTEEIGRRVFVEFDGVQKYCKVFVNGKLVGDHKGGYTGFSFDITGNVRFGADNVLAVAVNNRQDDPFRIPPMSAGNFDVYGGIYRDARIVIKDALYIPFQGSDKQEGGTFVTTPNISAKSSDVRVKTWVENDNAAPGECSLRTTITDAGGNVIQVLTDKRNIPPGELVEFDQMSAPILNPHLWSPETPYLYKVFSDVYVGDKAVDHFESPLGFRWFRWDFENNRLILNGKKVIIRGTNRHQEWPWLGDATPMWLQLLDMRDIRENLNDNFMRTAHYPQDPAIYNFCDSNGIIVIEESPNIKMQNFSKEVQVQQLREMIRRDRNHPSIFFWSMGNETDHAVDSKYAIAEDTNRIIYSRQIYNDSAGQFVQMTDKQLAIESMLRCTIRGWYSSDERDLEPKSVQQTGNEEWQHDQAAAAFMKNNQGRAADDLANLVTFVYEDHGAGRIYADCPMLYVNPKGWVDCWREPKFMYYLWQAWYSDKPMVYIHPEFWRSQYLGQKKEIVVDSNCETVELLANGHSIGVLKPTLAEANVVRFENVPVSSGVLTAIGKRGDQTVTNTVVMAGMPAQLTLSISPKSFKAALNSVAVVRADIIDMQGNHVYGATNTIYWSVSGPATLVGAPVYQTDTAKNGASDGVMYIDAPTFNIIRASGNAGEITVRVSSPGLGSAEAVAAAIALPEDHSTAIVQPPLPAGNRQMVAREKNSIEQNDAVVQEMKNVSGDLSFKADNFENYSNQIDKFLRQKNPAIDFNSPEYRAIVGVFAHVVQNSHGNLIRDDFNFVVGLYNDCRQITRHIDGLKLPTMFKQSLRESYAHAMIQKGEKKNFEAEIRWLQSLPQGKLVIAGVMDDPTNGTDLLFDDKTDLESVLSVALPEFKSFDPDERMALQEIVHSLNPNVKKKISHSGGEKINGVRQKIIEIATYEAAKGEPILIPDTNYLSAALRERGEERRQN